jgi:hypothetical protein
MEVGIERPLREKVALLRHAQELKGEATRICADADVIVQAARESCQRAAELVTASWRRRQANPISKEPG